MEQTKLILNLIEEGLRPLKIAVTCKIPIGQVTREITSAIQERRIKRSRVLATLDKEWHDQITVWFPAWKQRPRPATSEFIFKMLKESNLDDFDLDIEEVRLYLLCFEKGFKDGEIYEAVCEIERTLHTKIRSILIEKFGAQETGWWREGIPLDVRQYCADLREKDDNFTANQPFNYTTFGHLLNILKFAKNPNLFKSRLPLNENGKPQDMQTIVKELSRLVKVRNKIMHPIGAVSPTEEDFFFVKEIQRKLEIMKWR